MNAGIYDRRPKALDTDERYRPLSVHAKELYVQLLSRSHLSRLHEASFTDTQGLFVYYTNEEATEQLHCKRDKAAKVFRELEAAGLIRRRRWGCGHPYRIYVKDLLATPEKPGAGHRQKPSAQLPKNRPVHVGETTPSNTKDSNPEDSHTNSFMSGFDREATKDWIQENIAYEVLLEDYPWEQVDWIVDLMLSKICTQKPWVTISGARIPTTHVRTALLALDDIDIRYVLDALGKCESNIRSLDAYCLKLLYSAKASKSLYAQQAVNRDNAAGRL